ncbi:MAG: hypothetical protein HXY44_17510 [Syntrophaceae bacterium]|nr:hypothetical protein [Syntrophaceae bacterium]
MEVKFKATSKKVIPAEAEIHKLLKLLDSRWSLPPYLIRGGSDELGIIRGSLNILKSWTFLALILFWSVQTVMFTQLVLASPPSFPPLIATEDEVKDFFDQYIERYNRKDIDGFLWLFSLKAIQNEKDNIPEIRQIYNDFFNKSQRLGYHLIDPKIEIYQNAVEVKARFRVQQRLVKGGKEIIHQGRIRWVLIRENGALKILSLDYRLQAPP